MKNELMAALAHAQQEFPVIPKDKTAKVRMKSGGDYSYKYADLGSVVAATFPVLQKHGLVVQDTGEVQGNIQILSTILSHPESGQQIHSRFILPASNDPQDMGGSITYFRRYALCAILGIVTEDDIDAGGAGAGAAKRPPTKPPTPPPAGPKPGGSLPGRPVAPKLPAPPPEGSPAWNIVSEAQRVRLRSIQTKVGMPDDILKEIGASLQISSSTKIPKWKYETFCKIIEGWLA